VPQGATAAAVLAALQKHEILGGIDLGRFYPEFADTILMNATELTTDADIAKLASALATLVKEHALVRA
jgi:glycine cleavage system pyridoxal-binding protein P